MTTEVIFESIPKLKNPIFIEGLPGVGYIGRNAAGYLIEELKAKKFGEVYSDHFPPIVLLSPEKNGRIIPIKNELYYVKASDLKPSSEKSKKLDRDLIILIGDSQSLSSNGHYEVVRTILDELLKKYKISEIITIGGFGIGQMIEKRMPHVYGAAADLKHAEQFKKLGVIFDNTEVGQIIGASGLFISEGHRRGIPGVCLMGETSGILLSDPKSTESVLLVLEKYLNKTIDMTNIEKRVKETEKVIKKIESLQSEILKQQKTKEVKDEHLGYIG